MKAQTAFLLCALIISAAFTVMASPARAAPDATSPATTSAVNAESSPGKAYFVSPITELRYEIVRGAASGQPSYRLGEKAYGSVEEILTYEASLFPDGMYKLEPALRADEASEEVDGRLTVLIYLTSQFSHDVSTRIWSSRGNELNKLWDRRQVLLGRIMSTNILGPLPADAGSVDPVLDAQFRAADSEYAGDLFSLRTQIFSDTFDLNHPLQDTMVAKIENLGGTVIYRGGLVNAIGARISPAGLRELVKDPEVDSVYKDRIMIPMLDVSVPSINADDWWLAGYNTATYKFVVSDTGVDKTHPALSAVVTDEKVFHDDGQTYPGYNDNATNPDDLHGHGTHVAGIVGSQDATYRGVAYGLKGIVNAKFGWLTTSGGGGGSWLDAMKALDWAIVTAGASIGSLSYGDSTQGSGNGGFTRFLDAIVDDLGIPYAVAAGNDGPNPNTVGQPGDAYNVLVVGAIDDQGTTSRTGDAIAGFSSRGPTGDGRIKPDITAPGQDTSNPSWGIYSCNYKWETQSDWIDFMGTSMASPHIGGTLVLLANYFGPRAFAFPAIPKALLLENAEDKGTAGPDNNYGWGYVDLAPSLLNRDKVYNESVKVTEPKFYLGTWTAGDKATLVWQRHVVYKGATTPTQYYAPSNLDLFLYNGLTNAQSASSTSTIDNVEQARYGNALGTAVLKVKALSIPSGYSQDSFALATQRQFALVKPPKFTTAWGGLTNIEAGNTFTLWANVTNIGDLTAFGTVGTLTVPAGLTLISGTNPVLLGDMAAGTNKSSSWTFQAGSVGNKTLWFNVTSNSFGETYTGASSHTVRVMDSFPPTINGAWAQPSPQTAGLKVNITADVTDNLGVFTVRANVVGPKGFVGNYTMKKNPSNNIWYVDQPYFVAGLHTATIWASDLDRWTWAQTQFTMVDSGPPDILANTALPNPQQIHGNVNITAQITDQAGVAEARVEITDPVGGKTNLSLSSSGSSYWLDRQYDILGIYSYRISASDPTGNWRIALGSFIIVDTVPPAITFVMALPNPQFVFGDVNISARITDSGGVANAFVEVTDPLGGKTNVTLNNAGINYWNQRPYALLGNYSFRISAVDIVSLWQVATGSFRIIDPFLPIADAGMDAIVQWNATHTFDGSASTDNFGIEFYTWTFSDQGPVTLTGMRPTYRFVNLGTYTVTLTVKDYAANADNDTVLITVVDRVKPQIVNQIATPALQNPGVPVDISASITDNVGVAEAWINVIDPYTVRRNYSFPNVGGSLHVLTGNYTTVGIYGFEIWAKDTSGNWASASGGFEIRDMIRPAILSTGVQPEPQEVYSLVQITATIRDNVGVTAVWVDVDRPSGGQSINYTMSYDPVSGTYRRTHPSDALGIHPYVVWASDLAGNWNSSSGQFLIRDTGRPTVSPTNPSVRIEVDSSLNYTAYAEDNFRVDKVFANVSSPTGGLVGNYTMRPATGMGSNAYVLLSLADLGMYDVRLSVVDVAGNWGTSTGTIETIDSGIPVAEAGPDQSVFVGDLVAFDGSASTDAHGIASYQWIFVENGTQKTLIGPKPSYTFMKTGTYSVTLTVTDYGGNSDTDWMSVNVRQEQTGDGGNGGNGGNPLNLIVDGIVAYGPWSFILIMAAVIAIIAAAVARRKSKREKRERIEAAKTRANAAAAAARVVPVEEEFIPPPDDEYPEPSSDGAPITETPPPPDDEESATPPPPDD